MPRHNAPSSQRGPSQRQLRVGELLRHALSDILLQSEIRDPELEGISVTVTQVKPSGDMRHATVFVEPLGGKNAGQVVAALNRHVRYPRGEIGPPISRPISPPPSIRGKTTHSAEPESANDLQHQHRK